MGTDSAQRDRCLTRPNPVLELFHCRSDACQKSVHSVRERRFRGQAFVDKVVVEENNVHGARPQPIIHEMAPRSWVSQSWRLGEPYDAIDFVRRHSHPGAVKPYSRRVRNEQLKWKSARHNEA